MCKTYLQTVINIFIRGSVANDHTFFSFNPQKQSMMKFYKNSQKTIQRMVCQKKEIKLSSLLILISIVLQAQSFTVDGISYTTFGNNTSVEVTGGCMETVTIPETVSFDGNTYNVRYIDNDAFRDCGTLVNLTISNSITYIKNSAFRGCSNLTTLHIPSSVGTISTDAFRECSSLTSLTLPNVSISFGDGIFRECSSLESVTIPESFLTIPNLMFDSCTSLNSVTLPETLTSIGGAAFRICSSLTNISLPESLTNLSGNAFAGCSSLTSIIIPDSITSINSGVFFGCSSLTSITLPETLTSIGNSAFWNNQSLTSIHIPESVNSIGNGAFYFCINLTTFTLPENVTTIEDYTFFRCSSLTNFNIPNTVSSIGEGAFGRCHGLTNLTVNWDSPLTIISDVFVDTDIENITLNVPAGLVSIYEAVPVWMNFNPITDATLSTSEVASLNNVNLFPNPATDYISITNLNTRENYTVYDVLGKQVDSGRLIQGSKIQVANLEKGIYFLKLKYSKPLKFVKQ